MASPLIYMKIKHIFFDIDDTLFPTTEFAERARKNAVNAMVELGLDQRPAKLYKLLKKIIKEKGSNYPNHFGELCRKLKIKEKSRYVAAAVRAYHTTKNAIFPYPSAPRILLNLRDKRKIYIASDGNAIKQWDKLIRLGIPLLFNDVFISEELKEKKSVKFFKKILKKIKAKPEECLMIGDKPDSDVLYPKKLGIKTIRLKLGKFSDLKSKADLEATHFYEIPRAIKQLEQQK